MRVLSNIAEKAVRLVDGTASRWLTRLGEGEVVRAREVALFRRLVLAGLVGLALLPLALTLVLTPALALPLGATLVAAFFLFSVAAVHALQRDTFVPPPAAEPEDAAFDACPGLCLIVDPQGVLIRTGGRDRDAFPESMRSDGTTLVDVAHVSDRLALVQALDELRQGQPSVTVEARIQQPLSASGRQFLPVRFDMTAIRDAEGRFLHAFVQARDLCEEQERRLQADAHIAEARSAHEAKSRFLAAVSHELRTPLNAILGFSDVLAGEYFGKLENDRQREYVGLIRQSGAHLLSVVNTMLDMSKIEAGRYELIAEPFLIADAMETCRAMLDLTAREKGITLTSRASRGLGEVIADRRAVQQILINLAGNAIKFTGAGGVVSIDAMLSGRDVVIAVSDTGIGIAPDKLEFIGQPFMQVENAYTRTYEGTGLGLSLVKGLVALHGGHFAIASRPGEGTVVTVTLRVDGSGIRGTREDIREERIEFPPRLVAVRQPPMMDEQDFIDGPAQAKIA